MPIVQTGSALSQQVIFNTGLLSINGKTCAALQDVTVNANTSVREIHAIGTIKMIVPPKRYGYKVEVKAKTKSINADFYGMFFGYSYADSNGYAYNLKDGQNVLASCYITCIVNDDTNKTVQFQLKDAIISVTNLDLKMEDASEADVSITAADVTVVTNF